MSDAPRYVQPEAARAHEVLRERFRPTPRAEGLREALAARPKNGERIYVEEDDYVSGWGDAMSHVRAALAASDTAPDPLREILGGDYEVHSPDDGHAHITDSDGSIIGIRATEWTDGYEAAMRHCAAAALAASDTAPGLDAERLFEAFTNVNDGHGMSLAFWHKFAAEYARLASPDPTDKPRRRMESAPPGTFRPR